MKESTFHITGRFERPNGHIMYDVLSYI